MVAQYPHIATIIEPAQATRDAEGNWITSGPFSSREVNARFEVANSSAKVSAYVMGADGVKIEVSGTVYAPRVSERIKVGSVIEVKDGDEVIVKTTVKQVSYGFFNTRIWV